MLNSGKHLVRIGVLVGGFFWASTGANAGYRGAQAVEDWLNLRLIDSAQSEAVSAVAILKSRDARALLGTFSGGGLEQGYQNDQASAISLWLWQVFLGEVARDFGTGCSESPDKLFRAAQPESQTLLRRFCTWPAAEARNVDQLQELWLRVMDYRAPYDEFLVWANLYLSPAADELTGAAAVEDLLRSILFHPYFLFRL
jgi:hypothetical protein